MSKILKHKLLPYAHEHWVGDEVLLLNIEPIKLASNLSETELKKLGIRKNQICTIIDYGNEEDMYMIGHENWDIDRADKNGSLVSTMYPGWYGYFILATDVNVVHKGWQDYGVKQLREELWVRK